MNASFLLGRFPGWIVAPILIGLLSIAAPLGITAATNPPPPAEDPAATAPADPNRPPVQVPRPTEEEGASRTPADALVAAKLLEEGDGNPQQALRAYLGIIRVHDQRRPAIAEAIFRAGEVARRLGLQGDATGFYQRVVREFSDLPEVAQRGQERLDEVAEQGGALGGDAGEPLPMSPELVARYGLAGRYGSMPSGQPAVAPVAEATATPPSPDAGQPRPTFRMSPEMMRRYGLIPATPPTTTAPAAAPSRSSTPPDPGQPAPTSRMSPEMMRRYGLIPQTPATPPASAPSPAESELRALRAELVEARAKLRRIQREERALASVPIAENAAEVRHLPIELIEDARLLRMLDELDRLDEAPILHRPPESESGAAQAKEARTQVHIQVQAIRDYVQETLKRRLADAELLLQQEMDRLSVSIRDLEKADPAAGQTPSAQRF